MTRSRSFPLVFLALALWVPTVARAEDEPTRLPVPTPLPTGTTWFGVYMAEKKVGYGKEVLETRGEGDAAVHVHALDVHFEMKAMNKAVVIEISEEKSFRAAAPHELLHATARLAQGPVEKVVELRRAADGAVTATITSAGQARTMPVEDLDYTLADDLTEAEWVRSGPEVGAKLVHRSFDLLELEKDVTTTTVTDRKESVVEGVKVVWYEVAATSARKGDLGTARYGADGKPISAVIGGILEIRVEPEEVAKQLEESFDVFVMGIAKIDKPIGPAREVEELVVTVEGEGAAKLETAPRQSVEKDPATGAVVLSLGAEHGEEDPATEEEIAEALKETVDYPTKDAVVVAMAREATAGATTAREKVDRLVAFVGEFVKDELCPEPLSVLDLLARKEGDCSEHALLFATLARAAGIPAREVSGLMYMGDEVLAFGGHAWNEVVIDGKWVAVDATHAETEVDATHVALGRGEEEGMKHLAAMGRLSFSLKSVRAKEPAGAEK